MGRGVLSSLSLFLHKTFKDWAKEKGEKDSQRRKGRERGRERGSERIMAREDREVFVEEGRVWGRKGFLFCC